MTNEEKIYDLQRRNLPIKIYNEKGDEKVFCPKSESPNFAMWFYCHCKKIEKTFVDQFDGCMYIGDYEKCKHYDADKAKQFCQCQRCEMG